VDDQKRQPGKIAIVDERVEEKRKKNVSVIHNFMMSRSFIDIIEIIGVHPWRSSILFYINVSYLYSL
jgi:hypothetical protein